MTKDLSLGQWCKWLENHFSPEHMIPCLPVIIRLDGNNFSKWTKNLQKPFDEGLVDLMVDLTEFLVQETGAVVGYTQSDEITLVLYSDSRKSGIYHDGRKQKILSKLPTKCSQYFNEKRPKYLPNHNKVALFDARVYQTPTLDDAVAQLVWRENDATKNSVSMLAQAHFSHNELHKLNGGQMQDKLMLEKGLNWNNLPSKFKRGSYVRRVVTSKPFTAEEIDSLPPQHQARTNPDLVIKRSVISRVDLPRIGSITNRVGVFFKGEDPEVETK